MEFDNSFEVPLPPAEAWPVLMDIRRIAPCLPGAELTDVVDDKTYKGRIAVRLGPVALVFAGEVKFEEIDNAGHNARVSARGTDAKGRGGANATSAFRLEPSGSGSKVLVHTDLALSGAVAQYGRGVGIIQATAAQLMAEFAKNLRAQIAAAQHAPATPVQVEPSPAGPTLAQPTPAQPMPQPAPRPISGFTLMTKVIWNAIARLFGGAR